MKTIYRYDAPIADLVPIVMPQGARLLHVALSDRVTTGLAVWAEVDPKRATIGRVLAVVGTGHPLSPAVESGTYLGTFPSGPFVWHVYDCGVAVLNDGADGA